MRRQHTALILLTAALMITAGQHLANADPTPPSTQTLAVGLPGGSNYDFYYLENCYREPYNVVNSFNKAPNIIGLQLKGMKNSGQSRLSIGIFHRRGQDSGTIMDSTGGKLSTQNQQNLTNLLSLIKQTGFAEITVVFYPTSANNPTSWDSWQNDIYQENWQLIQTVHPIIAAAGLPYHIDLGNELTASTNQSVVLHYDQQLWRDYTAKFGSNDTVGFSVNSNDPGQILNAGNIYGTIPPPFFDLHIYGSEYDQYLYDSDQLRKAGYGSQPIIIGESYYNDDQAAENFSRAVATTGRPIRYLTQWPKTRANNAQCDQVDVAPPSDYDKYAARGF